jgi:hypothetical protein
MMVCVPGERKANGQAGTIPVAVNVTVQSVVAPSVKVMVPEGAVAPLMVLIVAVKVTDWFTNEVVGDDVRTMEVALVPTLCTSPVGAEALPVKFESALV